MTTPTRAPVRRSGALNSSAHGPGSHDPGSHDPDVRDSCARWPTFAVRLWLRCYTTGLPRDVRDDRRAEIESDLWEQTHDPAADPAAIGPHLAARALLGVPADLAWRLERSRLARRPQRLVGALLTLLHILERAGRWLSRRSLPGVATGLAVAIALFATLVIVTAPRSNNPNPTSDLIAWGVLLLLGAVLLAAGGRTIARRPRLGGVTLCLGSALTGLLLWPTLVAPLVAALLAWRAIARVRRAPLTLDE
jgi:hypothetical protein